MRDSEVQKAVEIKVLNILSGVTRTDVIRNEFTHFGNVQENLSVERC